MQPETDMREVVTSTIWNHGWY